MAFTSLWMDIESRKVFNLTIRSNVIYTSTYENLNSSCSPFDMIGKIIVPISRDIMRSKFVVYRSLTGNPCIAPIKDHHIDALHDDRSVLDSPIDIKRLYEILEM